MRFKEEQNSPVDSLLNFRETIFEDALEKKSISEDTLNIYRELARLACSTNPLARELPDFSMILLSGHGSIDSLEIARDKEL